MTAPSIDIAVWLERRLDVALDFHLAAARLYGIVVNDAERLLSTDAADAGAARSSFVAEHPSTYELITGSSGVLARSFDAAAIVTCGWAAPLDDGPNDRPPSRHPRRRRVRVVAVVGDDGVSSVIRFEDDRDRPVLQPERGVGDVVDALEEMWFGDPCALDGLADRLVNSRTTRSSCQRRT